MNDRFKFRVWSKECSEYVEQECCDCCIRYNGELECYNLKDTDEDCIYDGYPEDDAIVEQCTGLKDKNGKLIYEGDILGYFDNKIAVVYDNESPSFRLCGLDGSHYGHLSQEYVDSFGFKIIGNIHEKESK